MKKIYMLVAAAMMAACASAQVEEVLDLSEGSFTFTGEMWAETYNEEKPAIEVAPFSLSHLTSGDSWGGSFWEGFTICKSANNTEGGLAHQWSNMAGGGIGSVSESGSVTVDANAPYVLAYFVNWFGNENCTVSFTDGQKREAVGMYVVNTPYAYFACLNGEAPARAFDVEGDSFTITAHGVNGTTETEATLELVGYHNGTLSAVNDWTWWDLSGLGQVDKIYFTMNSTDTGSWGVNTPTYFAMDRLTVKPVTTAITDVAADREVASCSYVDMAGRVSAQPHNGLNIVVTRYTDGTQKTTKVVF